MNTIRTLLITLAAIAIAAAPALAETDSSKGVKAETQCAAVVRPCFDKVDVERSNCLSAAASNMTCSKTDLGKLTYQRWVMSPLEAKGLNAPSAFLGPKLVNESCIREFDNKLADTISKRFGQEAIQQLTSDLTACKRDFSVKLQRP